MLKTACCGFLVLLLLCATHRTGWTATLTVAADGGGDFASVHEALAEAEEGDTILFLPGEHVIDRPVRLAADSSIREHIAFRSEAGANETTVRLGSYPALDRASVFIFEDLEDLQVELFGLTITGGGEGDDVVDSQTFGGGVRIRNGPRVRIEACRITGNTASSGGGIHCRNATLTIVQSSISDNVSEWGSGGGLWVHDGSRLTMTSCVVRNNRAEENSFDGRRHSAPGGGISLSDESVAEIESCEIAENHSDSEAGGVFVGRFIASVMLRRCTIRSNTAHDVGGIAYCCGRGVVSLENCLIVNNRSPGYGALSGTMSLDHCTITGNAGLAVWNSKPTLRNCIVWSNSGHVFDHSEDGVPAAEYSCIEGDDVWFGEGNINEDPLFHGWGETSEVLVTPDTTDSVPGPASAPSTALEAALEFDLRLSVDSPCLGTAEDGSDMGADTGTSQVQGVPSRTVHLEPGEYRVGKAHLAHRASLVGSGAKTTSLRGTLLGARSGTRISDLTVTDGRAGGIRIPTFEEIEISQVVLRGNLAPDLTGGGVYCGRGSVVTVEECRIAGNAALSGGAIYCAEGSVASIDRSTLIGNLSASLGAAVLVDHETDVRLNSCLFVANLAEGISEGTALYVASDGRVTVTNCTVTENVTVNQGGSLMFFGDDSRAKIVNSILWSNPGRGIDSRFRENHPTIEYSNVFQNVGTYPGPGNRNDNPRFVDRVRYQFDRRNQVFVKGFTYDIPDFIDEDGDYRLSEISPLIDAGTPVEGLDLDLAGEPRVCGEGTDMGAYERCEKTREPFRRGDANADGKINVSDAIATLLWVHFDAFPITCQSAADADDGGSVDTMDAIVMLQYIFQGAAPLAAPGRDGCGSDPTVDELTCDQFDACGI